MPPIEERLQTGQRLARLLDEYHGRRDVVVVPVRADALGIAIEAAVALGVSLGTIVFVSTPADGDGREAAVDNDRHAAAEFPGGPPEVWDARDTTVILIDDGHAPIEEWLVAGVAVRQLQPRRVIAASPRTPIGIPRAVLREFDRVITLTVQERSPRRDVPLGSPPTAPLSLGGHAPAPARRRRQRVWIC